MKIAYFDTKAYDRQWALKTLKERGLDYEICFYEEKLGMEFVKLARGFNAVCVFVNDCLDGEVIAALAEEGVKLIALRCAGFDRVNLAACKHHGISVTRVPAYSPHAVAEFAATLMLALNRKVHIAYNRVRDGNFSLKDLSGMTLFGKTVGVVGTGRIGQCFIDIALGLGCRVVCYDVYKSPQLLEAGRVTYVDMDTLFAESDVISLHTPLLPSTFHLINRDAILKMKKGVIIINTSRGALVNARALIKGLKSGHVGAAGLDVYEEEESYFFEDRSSLIVDDDALARLQNMHNVLITSHQAFFTNEALQEIASVTFDNFQEFSGGKEMENLKNHVPPPPSPHPDVQAPARRASIHDQPPNRMETFEVFEPLKF